MLVCAISINAQLPEQGGFNTRVGTKDPKRVQGLVRNIFENPPFLPTDKKLTKDHFHRFYFSFRRLADIAPYVVYNFYNGDLWNERPNCKYGLYGQLIDSISTDPAMKMVVVNTILDLARNFVDNHDSVNVVRNNRAWQEGGENKIDPNDTLSLPVAMTKYAHLYFTYAGNPNFYPAHLYDKVQARQNFRNAFTLMRERNIDPGGELEGFYVNEYYRACEQLFKSDEEKYYEQFLQDYLEIVQTCDNLLIPYYDVPDSIKNDQGNPAYRQFQSYNWYTNHHESGVKALFRASGAAEPERLNKYYMDKLKANRTDNDFLTKSINILIENGCANTEAFFSYCEASYAIEPTFLNCFGSALSSKQLGMIDEMRKYFMDAYKHAENDLQRGTVAYHIGTSLNVGRPVDPATGKNYPVSTPQYEEWERNMSTASSNLKIVLDLQEALGNSPSIDVRKYPADAAYGLGMNIYRMINSAPMVEECDKAINYFQMSMAAAPDKYNRNAQDMIDRLTKVRAQLAERNRANKEHDKKMREYQEYLRKKKQEEDFWNQ